MAATLILTVCVGLAVGRFFRIESEKEGGLPALFRGWATITFGAVLMVLIAVLAWLPQIWLDPLLHWMLG